MSGRKEKAKRRLARAKATYPKPPRADSMRDVRQLFDGEGWEPVTEELKHELEVKGMPLTDEQYRCYKEEGAVYCRPRNSFIFPDEIERG